MKLKSVLLLILSILSVMSESTIVWAQSQMPSQVRQQWCYLVNELFNACTELGQQKDLSLCVAAGKKVYNGMQDKQLGQQLSTFCSGVCVAVILHKQNLLQEAQNYIQNCAGGSENGF